MFVNRGSTVLGDIGSDKCHLNGGWAKRSGGHLEKCIRWETTSSNQMTSINNEQLAPNYLKLIQRLLRDWQWSCFSFLPMLHPWALNLKSSGLPNISPLNSTTAAHSCKVFLLKPSVLFNALKIMQRWFQNSQRNSTMLHLYLLIYIGKRNRKEFSQEWEWTRNGSDACAKL